jgi:16S rRNA processing protein RimM
MSAAPGSPDLVAIGRVVKPQGRRGEVLAESFSDRPERFPSLRRAFVAGAAGQAREVAVTSCWPHKGGFVLKFGGVDSIEEAERLRGMEIRIGEQELPALPDGSYYHHQLRGLRVEDREGRALGVVADLLETGGASPVVVVRDGEAESLIPFAVGFVERVDLPAGRMVVVPPQMVDGDAED